MQDSKDVKAFAYLRVSGKGQVDGDGFPRQEQAVRRYALGMGWKIAQVFREQGVSGTKEWDARPAWMEMLGRITANGVRMILVERLDRLARDLMVQEHIIEDLRQRGIRLVSVHEPDLCSEDPTRKLMRQIMGAIAEYDKAMTVLKLRGARQRAREAKGRCEGPKPYGMKVGEEATVEEMRRLHAEGHTYAEITRQIEAAGHPTRGGGKWHVRVVQRVLERKQ